LRKIIYSLIGAPGCGKGKTLEHLMANVPNYVKLGTGDRFREEISKGTEIGQTIANYNHAGFLVPDEITIPLTFESLETIRQDPHKIILGDAISRTLMQYKTLARVAADWDYDLRTIYLTDPVDVCQARLVLADRNRSDDHPEVIENRMREYVEKTLPSIDFARRLEKGLFSEINSISLEDKLNQVLQVVLG